MADQRPETSEPNTEAGVFKRSTGQRLREWLAQRPPGLTLGAAACLIVAALAIGALVDGVGPPRTERPAAAGPDVLWYRSEPGGTVSTDVSDVSENLSDDRVLATAKPIQRLRATIELSAPSATGPEDESGYDIGASSPTNCTLMRLTPWPPASTRGNVTVALLAIYYPATGDEPGKWLLKLTEWEDGAQTTNVKQWIELLATAGAVTVKATAGDSLNIAAADGVIDQQISGERFEVSFGGDVAASKIGATVTISEPLPAAPEPSTSEGSKRSGNHKVVRAGLFLLALLLLILLAAWHVQTMAHAGEGRRAWTQLLAAAREAGALENWFRQPAPQEADRVAAGLLAKIKELREPKGAPLRPPWRPPPSVESEASLAQARALHDAVRLVGVDLSELHRWLNETFHPSVVRSAAAVLDQLAAMEQLAKDLTARLERPALAPMPTSPVAPSPEEPEQPESVEAPAAQLPADQRETSPPPAPMSGRPGVYLVLEPRAEAAEPPSVAPSGESAAPPAGPAVRSRPSWLHQEDTGGSQDETSS